MTDNVVWFPANTKLDIHPDRILEGAMGALDTVLLIGKTGTGALYLAASTSEAGELFILMERCKSDLVNRIEEHAHD